MDLKRAINDVIEDRLRELGEKIVQAQRQDLSEPGSPDVHSHPGEAPKEQTSRLANSFDDSVSSGELKLTSDCPYAKYLMDGTARIAPRDVLAGWHRVKEQIDAIMRG